jgi:hypothetical protein
VEDQNGFGIRLSHPGEQELAKHRCSRSTREGSRDTRRQTSIQTSPKSFAPSRIPAPSRSPTLPTPSPDDRPGSLDPKQSQQTRLTMMSIRPNDQTTKRANGRRSSSTRGQRIDRVRVGRVGRRDVPSAVISSLVSWFPRTDFMLKEERGEDSEKTSKVNLRASERWVVAVRGARGTKRARGGQTRNFASFRRFDRRLANGSLWILFVATAFTLFSPSSVHPAPRSVHDFSPRRRCVVRPTPLRRLIRRSFRQ